MNKIDILDPKLIVPDDYQQFLALFHISDVNWLLLPVKQKVHKNGTFGLKTHFKKIFLGYS